MNIFRWGSFALFSLFLSACQFKTGGFDLPDAVTFQKQRFEKVTQSQIDEMQQLLYLPAEGAKNAFAHQEDTQAKVEVVQNELRSEVLYPPTERFNDVQLEVSRGRDLQCGYAQMQFSDKRSAFEKKSQNLTAYQQVLSELAIEFSRLAWQVNCK